MSINTIDRTIEITKAALMNSDMASKINYSGKDAGTNVVDFMHEVKKALDEMAKADGYAT